MTTRYLRQLRGRGLPAIVDLNTGAIMRPGVRYPTRGGGTFEIMRLDLTYPPKMQIRVEHGKPARVGFLSRSLGPRGPVFAPVRPYAGSGKVGFSGKIGWPSSDYQWIPVRRLESGRAYVSLPPIDLGRIGIGA